MLNEQSQLPVHNQPLLEKEKTFQYKIKAKEEATTGG